MIGEYDWCLKQIDCKCFHCQNPWTETAKEASKQAGVENLFEGLRWYCEIWSSEGIPITTTRHVHSRDRAIKAGGRAILRMIHKDEEIEKWMPSGTGSSSGGIANLSGTSQTGTTGS